MEDWRNIQARLFGQELSSNGYSQVNVSNGVSPDPLYAAALEFAAVRGALFKGREQLRQVNQRLLDDNAWSGEAATAYGQLAVQFDAAFENALEPLLDPRSYSTLLIEAG